VTVASPLGPIREASDAIQKRFRVQMGICLRTGARSERRTWSGISATKPLQQGLRVTTTFAAIKGEAPWRRAGHSAASPPSPSFNDRLSALAG